MKTLYRPIAFACALVALILSLGQASYGSEPYIVKEILPYDRVPIQEPADFVFIGDTVFFTAHAQLQGIELWKSDGTEAGTVVVRDIYPGPGYMSMKLMGSTNGLLIFDVQGDEAYNGLWRSDGTEAGTFIIKPGLRPRAASGVGGDGVLIEVSNFGGDLFFAAYYDGTGREIWKTDGTSEGTVLVKNIKSDIISSNPKHLTESGGMLFFNASSESTGGELWKTDGTESGTVLVKIGFSYYNSPRDMTDINGTLFFWDNNTLWKSDGTESGTEKVESLTGSFSTVQFSRLAINGILYFNSPYYELFGSELWRSDGTPEGTFMLKDIWPVVNGSMPSELTELDGTLLFTADTRSYGRELWRSDGTREGTYVVKDIMPGGDGSGVKELTKVNGKVYFRAYDPIEGYELWQTDGTTAGTTMVKAIGPGLENIGPSTLTAAGKLLYFVIDDGIHGRELWALDTTPENSAQGTMLYE